MTGALGSAGLDVATVILSRPSLSASNARHRDRRGLSGIEQLWHGFDDLGNLERHVIDSGVQTAEETAERITNPARSRLMGHPPVKRTVRGAAKGPVVGFYHAVVTLRRASDVSHHPTVPVQLAALQLGATRSRTHNPPPDLHPPKAPH